MGFHMYVSVNGSWSVWGSWSDCNSPCSLTGLRNRNRTCDNPTPLNGGLNCPGNETETEACVNICRGKK